MTAVATRAMTARQLVADVAELVAAGKVDPRVERMVHLGLAAITDGVRDLAKTWPGLIDRYSLLELIDPDHPPANGPP